MAAAVETRLSDYLNDKLQTYADLDPESLDALIAGVRDQHKLLQQQLDDASRDLQTAHDASQKHAARASDLAASFQQQQADIDTRLVLVTNSTSSDGAAEKLQASMEKLHTLDVANNYIQMLHDVDVLINDASNKLKTSPEAALSSYSRLRNLVTNLQPLQAAAEGAAPHLVDNIEARAHELRNTIKDGFAADLNKLMDKILWPKPGVSVPDNLRPQWDSAVAKLLLLQRPELEAQRRKNDNEDPLVLLPLEVLVQPLETRFKYHFSGDRPTNRLDKPEYFLSHITDLLDSHGDFVTDYVQPVILRQFRGTTMTENPLYIDAISALINALLPMLRIKIYSVAPQLTNQPQLFSHFVHELMNFDDTLRTDWRYTTADISSSTPWRGLTFELLNSQNLFPRWLEIESTFALKRYESIIDNSESNSLDFDSLSPKSTKPTKAAVRVHDLLSTVTTIYKPLQSFSQKMRFLIDIQIAILDRFHARLHSSLEAFQSLTHSLGRTVQGSTPEEAAKTQGVSGLDHLCRIYGSADYLEGAMRDWSDDIFFLDVWRELQERVAARGDSDARLAGSSVADIAQRTSSTLVATSSDDEIDNDNEDAAAVAAANAADTGSVFDETATAYARLRSRAATALSEILSRSIKDALRPYTRASHQFTSLTTPSEPDAEASPSPTPSLDAALGDIRKALTFLARALSTVSLRAVTRPALKDVDAYLFDRVVAVMHFSALGGRQVRADVAAVVAIVDDALGPERGAAGLARCVAGAWILGLPAVDRSVRDEDEGADAWDADGADESGNVEPSVHNMAERLFGDHDGARAALDEFGLEPLSVADARRVVRQRVEVSA